MNRKLYRLITLILCVCFIFSEAAAFDSPWSHYTGPIVKKDAEETPAGVEETPAAVVNEPEEKVPAASGLGTDKPQEQPKTELPVVSEIDFGAPFDEPSQKVSLTLNDIKLYGTTDASTAQVLDTLTGLKLSFENQKGDRPRKTFDLSLKDTALLNFDIQGGHPYFVTTNLLGGGTYMINDADQFEENLAASIYELVQQMNEGSETSSMPSLEEIQSSIGMIREAVHAVSNGEVEVTNSISLEEEVNPTALVMGVSSVMEKFTVDDPTSDIAYHYMDFSEYFSYEWPSADGLPQPAQSYTAMSGILENEDLLAIIDQLPTFYEDNPELAEKLNQAMIDGMKEKNPEMSAQFGDDFLGGFTQTLRDAVAENMKDFSMMFKMDQDANGSPVLITIWVGQKAQDGSAKPESGVKISILSAANEGKAAFELDADFFQGQDTMPMFRALLDIESGAESLVRANAIFGTDPSSLFEYAQVTKTTEYMTMTRDSDTTIDLTASGMSLHANVYKVAKPNLFDTDDTTTVTDLTISMGGQPAFSISLTAEKSFGEPMAKLTASDAIAASGMTKADYDTLAQMLFMQIMTLVMSFS